VTYTVSFSLEFARNFARFPAADQVKIIDFQTLFESVGLGDFSKYPGKIAPSWSGSATRPAAAFAKANDLWHYHVGIPTFKTTVGGMYMTSDWLLHFQWPDWRTNGPQIHIVDLLPHNGSSGAFNLPSPTALP
jgi:hypothetical protein